MAKSFETFLGCFQKFSVGCWKIFRNFRQIDGNSAKTNTAFQFIQIFENSLQRNGSCQKMLAKPLI